MKCIKQKFGKLLEGGARIYIQDRSLKDIGFTPGTSFNTTIKQNKIILEPDNKGHNTISKKIIKGEEVPVLDKRGKILKSALENCSAVKIYFYEDENGTPRVMIEGIKDTSSTIKENLKPSTNKLTSITFCAGSGISSRALEDAGFREVAACEWMPKSRLGSDDRFSKIYEKNHPDTLMLNVPMQYLKGSDLPYADLWNATLDCTDFSLVANKKDLCTIHLFTHLLRLFWEKPKSERPKAILVENVPPFEKVAGNCLKLCLEEEGYNVTTGKLNSLDYSSRTKRERFFLVATIFEGFTFPKPTGKLSTPIIDDEVISVDNIHWDNKLTSNTLKYFIERNNSITHNHKIRAYDPTVDSHVGTITKSQCGTCENLLKHPTLPDTYSFINNENHLRYLQGIPYNYYLGDSKSVVIDSIGQSVCFKTFLAISKKIYNFLLKNLNIPSSLQQYESSDYLLIENQYCFDFDMCL